MPFPRYVFLWENFGPQHHDRLRAVVDHFGPSSQVVGLELSKKSSAYLWHHEKNMMIEHHILCHDAPHFFERSIFEQIFRLIPIALKQGRAAFLLCHYEKPVIFILACILRLLRRRVIIMNDSKFDDYDRSILREMFKAVLYLPYQGALVASHRSASYLKFLGIKRTSIRLNYDNLSRDRIRSLVSNMSIQRIESFQERPFIVIARLIEKKNLFRTIDAYALYRKLTRTPRDLEIIGYGPLEMQLKSHVAILGIESHVKFAGALSPEDIPQKLIRAVSLLLLSTEEQFGQVVLEAQALAIPVIVSHAVGAVDCFVKNNINGLIVDPFDTEEIAIAMKQISEDEVLWSRMSRSSEPFSEKGDARYFAQSVEDLTQV